jgi:uncharacterized membrane protein
MTKPIWIFFFIAAVFGLFFTIAEPPTRFPDEVGHYERTAKVAAVLFHYDTGNRDTVLLPEQFAVDLEYFWRRAPEAMSGHPFGLDELISRIGFSSRPDEGSRRVAILPAQLMAADIGYAPQAIGFEIARRTGGSFLVSVWAGRFAALAASLLVTMLALRMMPDWARWTSAALSLLPMAVYLRGSLSPDATLIAVTLLATAAFLAAIESERLPWPSAIIALISCIYLALVKPPYICILVLSLLWLPPLARWKRPQSHVAIGIVAAIAAVTVSAAAWHTHDVASYVAIARVEITPAEYEPSAKLHMLLISPLQVAGIFARTAILIPSLVYGLIARFGLADINPNPLLHGLVMLWCAGVLYLDRIAIARKASLTVGAILLLTFISQCFAVAVTIWVSWSSTADPLVVMQGRYLLPALICGVLGAAIFVLRPIVARGALREQSQFAVALMPKLVAGGAAMLLAASATFLVLGDFCGIKTFNKICLHELCRPD